jgi:hypothetical protein
MGAATQEQEYHPNSDGDAAWTKAASVQIETAGFRVTGINPFNPNIFQITFSPLQMVHEAVVSILKL